MEGRKLIKTGRIDTKIFSLLNHPYYDFTELREKFVSVTKEQSKRAKDSLINIVSSGIRNELVLENAVWILEDLYNDETVSEQAYRSILDLNPENINVINNLALHLYVNNLSLDEALSLIEIGLKIEPSTPELLSNKAMIMFQEDIDVNLAFQICKSLVNNKSADSEAYRVLGDIYTEELFFNLDEAIECYRKAIDIDPCNLAGRYNLIEAHCKRRDLISMLKETLEYLNCMNYLDTDLADLYREISLSSDFQNFKKEIHCIYQSLDISSAKNNCLKLLEKLSVQ